VIGTDMRSAPTEADEFHVVPAANHPDFMSVLQEIARDREASLLIPTVSEELPVIAKDTFELRSLGCMVMIAPYAATAIAHDKLFTALCLEKHNLSVARSLDGSVRHQDVAATLGFPLIAKPRVSRGGRGVVLHKDIAGLAEEKRGDIVYQQFASGLEFDVNLFMDQQGNMQACVVLLKTQLREGVVGNALAVERVQHKEVAELGRRACEAIGLTGPADIDIRFDREGIPKLLEINARIGANILFAEEVMESLLAEWQASTNPRECVS
jgi:carbamoyl-phosphate synthase large subunit